MSISLQEKKVFNPRQTKALPSFLSNFTTSLSVLGMALIMATGASNSSFAASNKNGDKYRSSNNTKILAKGVIRSRAVLKKSCRKVGGTFHSAPNGYSCVVKGGMVACNKGSDGKQKLRCRTTRFKN